VSGRYRAVVFDLDGVLWDGEPIYHEAFNVVLKPYGHVVTWDEYENIIGNSVEAAWAWVLQRFGITDSPGAFYLAYDVAVLELLAHPVEPLPGVRELLRELKSRGVLVGLASASLRQWVDATLAGIGLADEFGTTVAAGEVPHAKPAPDLYLKAAANLGVDPKLCVAVEDTPSGVRAAKAAGMYAIQIRAASTALAPIDEADAVIEDFGEFDRSLLSAG
jgi:HAD superfamily hydrolase (TIGR01509 family)